jgi:hypothetical protein
VTDDSGCFVLQACSCFRGGGNKCVEQQYVVCNGACNGAALARSVRVGLHAWLTADLYPFVSAPAVCSFSSLAWAVMSGVNQHFTKITG